MEGIIPYREDIWFSPRKVIRDFGVLMEKGICEYSSEEQKLIHESFRASVMLLGIMSALKKEYWLQLVNPEERTPDIRTMCMIERENKSDLMEVQDLEIVTYGDHASSDIGEFLKITKLSAKKAYPNHTTILCFLDKTMPKPNWVELNGLLAQENIKQAIYVVGRISGERQDYCTIQIHPDLGKEIPFNLLEASKNLCTIDARKVSRGTIKKEGKIDTKYFPFWK